jgi:hypothetical protein
MRHVLRAFLLIVVVSSVTRFAGAELWECDGKWTNKACNGTVRAKMAEVVTPESEEPLSIPEEKTNSPEQSDASTGKHSGDLEKEEGLIHIADRPLPVLWYLYARQVGGGKRLKKIKVRGAIKEGYGTIRLKLVTIDRKGKQRIVWRRKVDLPVRGGRAPFESNAFYISYGSRWRLEAENWGRYPGYYVSEGEYHAEMAKRAAHDAKRAADRAESAATWVEGYVH